MNGFLEAILASFALGFTADQARCTSWWFRIILQILAVGCLLGAIHFGSPR